jgi:hypothetical protein
MRQINSQITKKELRDIAAKSFGQLVKAVVDTARNVLVIDMSLHADGEAFLLSSGSNQEDIWGINLYPDLEGDDFIEFDSMINVRPNRNNMSRGIDAPAIKEHIRVLVMKYIGS